MDSPGLLDLVRTSPKDRGVLKLIVLRLPGEQRRTPAQAALDSERGVEGDRWNLKPDANPLSQVSVINARFLEAIAGDAGRMNLAGDNLVIDLDLSEANLPAGTRLRIGPAVIEVTSQPHTGCQKFHGRYGKAAFVLVNAPEGRALRLRGLYARVIRGGKVHVGDPVSKEAAHA
ncbi:MAG TPA: MOSC domain-containing protein [Verrucomicrobiae bacterium]|nr:MOSC domain-containing protein [Verrucomicrobiae bacterium]